MDAAIAALIGVGVGSLIGLAGQWLTSSMTYKHEMRKAAYQAAVEEWKGHIEIARLTGRSVKLYPLAHYLAYHSKLSQTPMRSADFARVSQELSELRKRASGNDTEN